MKIHLIPYSKEVFKSSLSKIEIEQNIKDNIVWSDLLFGQNNKDSIKDFEGNIKKDKFQFRRIFKKGYNSFIPIVSGETVDNNGAGSIVMVKIIPHKLVLTFIVFFIIFGLFNQVDFSKNNDEPLYYDQVKELLTDNSIDEQTAREVAHYFEESKAEEKEVIDFSWLLILSPYLIMIIIFNYEIALARSKLKEILKT
ncbi:hypothetical protein [Brumimicrobium aurantiacum]|uniref:Uncharacterized protein n=1 Tax=Brumimicrobium aurantiacum TaxID=1737063 RepID=A0A3E1EV70_9FLAO|nr:hypothetical protein [Brumimicrobium aurantiacum]RFC53412.1 hypothetical protein DXU93_13355 [Brumimicrobium aurantiacum]